MSKDYRYNFKDFGYAGNMSIAVVAVLGILVTVAWALWKLKNRK